MWRVSILMLSKIGPIVTDFKFIQPNGALRLCLETTTSPQPGWTVHPKRDPMEVCACYV